MHVEAIKPVRYAGESHEVGDQFDVTKADGRILVAIGKVKPVRKTAPKPAEKQAEIPNRASRKRGTYHRRDMKAE